MKSLLITIVVGGLILFLACEFGALINSLLGSPNTTIAEDLLIGGVAAGWVTLFWSQLKPMFLKLVQKIKSFR
jgi:hypothetical protein